MIPKLRNEKSKRCRKQRLQQLINRYRPIHRLFIYVLIQQIKIFSVALYTAYTYSLLDFTVYSRARYEDPETSRFAFMQDLYLDENITNSYSDEKFGETRHRITANSNNFTTASQEKGEEKKYLISSSSSLSLSDSNDIHLPNFHFVNDLRLYLPSCFRLKRIACPSFLQIVYTSITLFHLLSCSNHGMFVLCFEEELYSRGNQGDILSKAVHLEQPFPEYYDDYNTVLGKCY